MDTLSVLPLRQLSVRNMDPLVGDIERLPETLEFLRLEYVEVKAPCSHASVRMLDLEETYGYPLLDGLKSGAWPKLMTLRIKRKRADWISDMFWSSELKIACKLRGITLIHTSDSFMPRRL